MIAAISMVRNESDVIGLTVRHLIAHGVDCVIVADNLSTDDTPGILRSLKAEHHGRILTTIDTDPAYTQDVKMTKLAGMAVSLGAEWVLPFDADEIWFPSDGSTLAQFFAESTADVVQAWGHDHIARADTDPPFSPYRRSNPQPLPKVAFRAHPEAFIAMGNHSVDRPGPVGFGLTYRHFQYRTLDQYARKVRQGAAAYAHTDMPWHQGQHWREDAALSDDELAAKWEAMAGEPDLVYDPAPVKP